MTTTLTIRDEPVGGTPREALTLELPSDELTVRELIRERVHQEVKDFNARPKKLFSGLVQPTDSEANVNGYALRKQRMIDWEPQFDLAVEAFENNGFLVLVDGRQAESLDERLRVTPSTAVTFVKLMPLVGG